MKVVYEKNDRVMTPLGVGKVVYKRMNSCNLNEVIAYSILLDEKVMTDYFDRYTGTMFSADKVTDR